MEYKPRGKFFEDFEIGEEIVTFGRTVTEGDIMTFAGLTADYNQLHINEQWMKENHDFGHRIAHGMLGASILVGLMVQTGMSEGTCLALMETKERYMKPIFIGDTVHAEAKVLDKKELKKGDRGIVTIAIELKNQRGEVVTEQTQTSLYMRRV